MESYVMGNIHSLIKEMQGEKRYQHTLGVEEEAYRLGKIFLPQKCDKLALAGVLHDITKKLTLEEQIKLCDEYGISIDKENVAPKLLHAKTGCEFARRHFGKEIVDDEIYTSILYHTTGKVGMTLFEALIYLADYIEPTRTFEDCVKLREFFYENIEKDNSDKLEVLRKTLILSFDMTIKNLIEENQQIDNDSIEVRNYFIRTKSCFKSK